MAIDLEYVVEAGALRRFEKYNHRKKLISNYRFDMSVFRDKPKRRLAIAKEMAELIGGSIACLVSVAGKNEFWAEDVSDILEKPVVRTKRVNTKNPELKSYTLRDATSRWLLNHALATTEPIAVVDGTSENLETYRGIMDINKLLEDKTFLYTVLHHGDVIPSIPHRSLIISDLPAVIPDDSPMWAKSKRL